jgi:hypothetical protein
MDFFSGAIHYHPLSLAKRGIGRDFYGKNLSGLRQTLYWKNSNQPQLTWNEKQITVAK